MFASYWKHVLSLPWLTWLFTHSVGLKYYPNVGEAILAQLGWQNCELYCVSFCPVLQCKLLKTSIYCIAWKQSILAQLGWEHQKCANWHAGCEHSRSVLILKINKKYLVVDFQKPIDTGAPEKCLEEWVTGGDWLAWIWQQSLSVLTCNNTIKQLYVYNTKRQKIKYKYIYRDAKIHVKY